MALPIPHDADPADDPQALAVQRRLAALLQSTAVNGDPLHTLVNSWVKSRTKTPQGRQTYRYDIATFLLFCVERGHDPLTLGINQMSDYPDWLAEQRTRTGDPYSYNFTRRKITAVSSFYRFLVEDVAVRGRSPVLRSIRMPRHKSDDNKFLEPEQVAVLLEEADKGHRTLGPHAAKLAIMLMFVLGIRASEVANLLRVKLQWRRSPGDTERSWSITFIGKGLKEITRPIPAVYGPTVLEPYLDNRPQPADEQAAKLLILTLKGKPTTRFQYVHLVKRLARALELDDPVTPHWGRHTAKVIAELAGVDLGVISANFDHASIETTANYGRRRHTLAKDMSHAVAAIVSTAQQDRQVTQSTEERP